MVSIFYFVFILQQKKSSDFPSPSFSKDVCSMHINLIVSLTLFNPIFNVQRRQRQNNKTHNNNNSYYMMISFSLGLLQISEFHNSVMSVWNIELMECHSSRLVVSIREWKVWLKCLHFILILLLWYYNCYVVFIGGFSMK